MSELVKYKPWEALQGPKGCGYLGCKSSFYDSIGCYLSEYPQVLKCQARQPLHDVNWSDPEGDGCKDHADSPYWSHVLIPVKLQLIYLEKQVQRKFRAQPHMFPLCKSSSLRVSPNQELAHIEFLMPFSFKQLVNWGKLRDFNQKAELQGIDGLPEHLIDFATFLKGGQSGPPSGSGSGPPVKVGVRALKIKKLKSDNVISPMSQGSKHKYDCLSSG